MGILWPGKSKQMLVLDALDWDGDVASRRTLIH